MTNEYATSNLNVASYLMARKFELDHLAQRGETVYFVFKDEQGIAKQTVDEYYSGALVCVRDFVHGLKICRDRLFESKRQQQYQGIENEQAQRILGQ